MFGVYAVEIAPEVDSEAVIVASQCLADVFGLDVSRSTETESELPDLVHLFRQFGYDASTRNLPEILHTNPVPHKTLHSEEGIAGSSQNAVRAVLLMP